ncbi:MAG: biopolymer transporter ExbD [Gammaproteobacteria bacterium]|jgi:biopolymer transport protein ExbD|nr:biopolymer transporter ExbD [Gammaproteobacteria bacterium]
MRKGIHDHARWRTVVFERSSDYTLNIRENKETNVRRRRAIIGEETEEIDLTPMLDVVFIMLIFFIVTATFVKEIGIDVNSPDKNQNVKDADKQSIVVQITNRDRIRIRGRDIDFRAVRANIERLHAENPDAPVVVQPHPDSTTETMIHVMDSARQAGVYAVSIAAT